MITAIITKQHDNNNNNRTTVLPFLPLLQLLECLSGYMVATACQWSFHLISITTQDWTGLWIPSLNLPLLLQMNWFWAPNLTDLHKGKSNIMWQVVPKRYSAKKLSYQFLKIHREVPVWQSLSNIVKSFQVVRFATLLKKHPLTGVWEQAICRFSRK